MSNTTNIKQITGRDIEFRFGDTEADENSKFPRIIGTAWRTATINCIGFVAVQTSPQTWKCYVGVADGEDEYQDARKIVFTGGKLLEPEARAFFPWVNDLVYID